MSKPPLKRPPTSGTRTRGSGNWASSPAKGMPERAAKAATFEAGNKVAAGPHDMSDAEQSKRLLAMYVEIAEEDTNKPLERVAASEAWHDRKFGKSVARNVNLNTDEFADLDDDALARRQADLERELRAASGREEAPSAPHGPARVVN